MLFGTWHAADPLADSGDLGFLLHGAMQLPQLRTPTVVMDRLGEGKQMIDKADFRTCSSCSYFSRSSPVPLSATLLVVLPLPAVFAL